MRAQRSIAIGDRDRPARKQFASSASSRSSLLRVQVLKILPSSASAKNITASQRGRSLTQPLRGSARGSSRSSDEDRSRTMSSIAFDR
jgi:hypothetical protein